MNVYLFSSNYQFLINVHFLIWLDGADLSHDPTDRWHFFIALHAYYTLSKVIHLMVLKRLAYILLLFNVWKPALRLRKIFTVSHPIKTLFRWWMEDQIMINIVFLLFGRSNTTTAICMTELLIIQRVCVLHIYLLC